MNQGFIYPCNPIAYDIFAHFSNRDTIVWKAASDIKKGDTVYIYVGKTLREIKYKCVVIDEHLGDDVVKANSYAIPKGKTASKCSYLLLKLEEVFPDGMFPLHELKANGMLQFMAPMHVSDRLDQYLRGKQIAQKA